LLNWGDGLGRNNSPGYSVNISDFRLGRDSNSQALAVVKVDEDVKRSLLDELSSLDTCISVTYVVI